MRRARFVAIARRLIGGHSQDPETENPEHFNSEEAEAVSIKEASQRGFRRSKGSGNHSEHGHEQSGACDNHEAEEKRFSGLRSHICGVSVEIDDTASVAFTGVTL